MTATSWRRDLEKGPQVQLNPFDWIYVVGYSYSHASQLKLGGREEATEDASERGPVYCKIGGLTEVNFQSIIVTPKAWHARTGGHPRIPGCKEWD